MYSLTEFKIWFAEQAKAHEIAVDRKLLMRCKWDDSCAVAPESLDSVRDWLGRLQCWTLENPPHRVLLSCPIVIGEKLVINQKLYKH